MPPLIDMKKRLAELTSNILNPFLISFVVIALLSFKSTSSTSAALKWSLISIALSVLPVLLIVVYSVRHRKLEGVFAHTRQQRNRIYMAATICAIVGCAVLYFLGAPVMLLTTFVAGLVAIVVFMVINLMWKISLHTAFVAASATVLFIIYGTIGALTIVLIPPVAWARIEMSHHSPAQVATGALLAAAIVAFVFLLFGITGSHA